MQNLRNSTCFYCLTKQFCFWFNLTSWWYLNRICTAIIANDGTAHFNDLSMATARLQSSAATTICLATTVLITNLIVLTAIITICIAATVPITYATLLTALTAICIAATIPITYATVSTITTILLTTRTNATTSIRL